MNKEGVDKRNEVILPCPFCGEIPQFRLGNEHCFIGGFSNDVILECCIDMRVGFGEYTTETITKEEATKTLYEKWNKRFKFLSDYISINKDKKEEQL
jgi:hypothetical protein